MDTTARKEIAAELSHLLGDTYATYVKTHGYHWNVTGPMFHSLHLMFEEQYNDLWLALDTIAERLRALGEHAPGSPSEFAELTTIPEDRSVTDAMEMIHRLVESHEACIETARSVVEQAEAANDAATADLATERIEVHDKFAWMLRATAA
jgi:starvation-inducible DNA-binding protein